MQQTTKGASVSARENVVYLLKRRKIFLVDGAVLNRAGKEMVFEHVTEASRDVP